MDLILRFLLGGAIVSVFSIGGDVLKPKSFAGLFGGAPSVAIATLALACAEHSAWYVRLEARSMAIGAIALCAYGVATMALLRRRDLSPWLAAGILWSEWLAVAFAGWGALR